ncbi:MAG: phosphoserine transaminase [Spirochaetes bacterium GWD1_61_31]|nr:MAG: phosphoserine transaminase [Spirochaetes bacterium GWB1_60_80]OHD28554.1 MAG: phosphoserine transaminase [Spirochaetes bacterium GWC1_61_12]OHD37357.1 MAG: phosphoserine transaminase [Spirochaetes bacterium GWD1_61_31]OHD41851.1 MAG: phosphoserine transaminase [Spirochaetes bacterium GWE1_60_18]OHD57832.1 MAG: phosphoserine transaminase [Spirochaetes bacterium GWF1_60_12]HAP42570.1 3-phosphoserine/phosphohydroxythreonine transaminase [Spirochaetaceae bacterium]
MKRVINYSAGPAAIPVEVLEQARDEMLDWNGTGCSVMEVSHRGKEYDALHMETMDLFRELAGLPKDYHVLFTTGGASTQFMMLPWNFLGNGKDKQADYILTGNWAKAAAKEAKRYGKVTTPANMELEGEKFVAIPKQSELALNPAAEYVHYTSNNTVCGTQWQYIPDVKGKPLVCDMSSDIFSRPLDFTKFSMFYAGAQKNLGPSGVTVVAMKNDFLTKAIDDLPTMMSYKVFKDKQSMHNTPPCFSIYILNLTMKWLKKNGGLAAMGKINDQKQKLLYAAADNSAGFYQGLAKIDSRSWMNIDFKLPKAELDEAFIKAAKAAGIVQTKGYRSMGGIRLSAYNAVSLKDVQTTIQFMDDFRAKNS